MKIINRTSEVYQTLIQNCREFLCHKSLQPVSERENMDDAFSISYALEIATGIRKETVLQDIVDGKRGGANR